MRRSGYLARQQRLLRLLDERRELSVEKAAAELGCSRRTIYRDFLVLSETGVPIYPEAEGKRVRWRLVDGPKRRLSITLSFSEMLALTAGRDLLAGLTGTFFHEAAITALEKIRAALPDPLLARADATADLVLADKRPARDYRSRGEAVRTLVDAIDQHETVNRVYDPEIVARAIGVLRDFTKGSSRVVGEGDVQGWVDACYEPIADNYLADLAARTRRIRDTVIAVNRPLNSDRSLRDEFLENFDGTEVVPLCYRDEHERRMRDEPLTASFLHVPISAGQFHRLRRTDRIIEGTFVSAPYSTTRGLDLTFRDDQS